MLVASVVGARPQFVKLASVDSALRSAGIEHFIVHTGQHYERDISEIFFEQLGIPSPDVNLGVGSGTHGAQTGAILAAIDPILSSVRPDWVLVYGDTNSTLAAAISTVKMHIPLAHLEAGLRSFNRKMPEEHNRVLTDHAADLCLAPTRLAIDNLSSEGLAERSVLVGDVMADVCMAIQAEVRRSPPTIEGVAADTEFYFATLHRAENTDEPRRLAHILAQLASLELPVVLPVHPRLRERCGQFDISLTQGALVPVSPLGYPQTVSALMRAVGVFTDSGGLQKEAYLTGTPCTTIRPETEWPETLVGGWNVLMPECERLVESAGRPRPTSPRGLPFGGGDAAHRVVKALCEASAKIMH